MTTIQSISKLPLPVRQPLQIASFFFSLLHLFQFIFIFFKDTHYCFTIRRTSFSFPENQQTPPSFQEQEHQVQRVRSTVCILFGVQCVEFLHPHYCEFRTLHMRRFSLDLQGLSLKL